MQYERRGRRFGPRFPPKPVELGKEYDVEIQETSRRGEGIARIKGLVCFEKPKKRLKAKRNNIGLQDSQRYNSNLYQNRLTMDDCFKRFLNVYSSSFYICAIRKSFSF
jgi:hypothetical protein